MYIERVGLIRYNLRNIPAVPYNGRKGQSPAVPAQAGNNCV